MSIQDWEAMVEQRVRLFEERSGTLSDPSVSNRVD